MCGRGMWGQKTSSGGGEVQMPTPGPGQPALDARTRGSKESPAGGGGRRVLDVPLAFAAVEGRPESKRAGERQEREDAIDVDADPPPPPVGWHLFYPSAPDRGTQDGCQRIGVGKEESSRPG